MLTECPPILQNRAPLKAIRRDLDLVRRGQPALHSTEDLLKLLHLDSEKKDGMSLVDRLVKSSICDKLSPVSKSDKDLLRLTVGHVDILFTKLSIHKENPQELKYGMSLIKVVEKQIMREDIICNLASIIYMTAAEYRPDLVNSKVVEKLADQESNEAIVLLFQALGTKNPILSKDIQGRIIIVNESSTRDFS